MHRTSLFFKIFAVCLLSTSYFPRDSLACLGKKKGISSPAKCLHIDTEVTMADGKSLKRAGDLLIGDLVWDGDESTAVIRIAELDAESEFEFVEFKTENGRGSTTLTPTHLVFAAGQCERRCGEWSIKRADNLTIGECVPTANGGEDRIATINRARLQGRILPITESGKITAGGVVVTCYSAEYDGRSQRDEKRSILVSSMRQLFSLGEKIYAGYDGESILSIAIETLGLDKLF